MNIQIKLSGLLRLISHVVNTSEQLSEMAIGVRQQFDVGGVVLGMGAAGLSGKIMKVKCIKFWN